jgi:Fur family iron response transcriptional regulator
MLTETQPDLCCDLSATGCWKREACAAASSQLQRCDEALRRAGLRPTLQRRQLSQLLFGNGDCHVTAEALYEAAIAAGMKLSQATVYNTLNQFTQLGLLRQIGVDGSKSFFDTNTTVHPHFFFEDEGRLIDVSETVAFDQLPEPLPGFGMERVDVVIHLRRKPSAMSAPCRESDNSALRE